jgi:hypothetical protein
VIDVLSSVSDGSPPLQATINPSDKVIIKDKTTSATFLSFVLIVFSFLSSLAQMRLGKRSNS